MAAERSPILSEVRATLGIAAPLAAANLAQMAMGITNTIMVGELGGAPAFLGFAVFRFLLVASFRTRIVMLVPLCAIPVNAALNWVLIFGHFGLPAFGSAGSGCSTAIVQWLMLLSLAGYMLRMPTQMPVRLAVRVLSEIPRLLRLGLPIGVLLGLEVGVFAMTGILMGLMGADALGAHQLVLNVASLTFMVPLVLSQAATMLVAAIGYWVIGFAGSWVLAFPLGLGPIGLWLGLALGLAVVATSLIVRLRVRARTQMRATPAPLLAVKELPA